MPAASWSHAAATLVGMPSQARVAGISSATDIFGTADCHDVVTCSGCSRRLACQTLVAIIPCAQLSPPTTSAKWSPAAGTLMEMPVRHFWQAPDYSRRFSHQCLQRGGYVRRVLLGRCFVRQFGKNPVLTSATGRSVRSRAARDVASAVPPVVAAATTPSPQHRLPEPGASLSPLASCTTLLRGRATPRASLGPRASWRGLLAATYTPNSNHSPHHYTILSDTPFPSHTFSN